MLVFKELSELVCAVSFWRFFAWRFFILSFHMAGFLSFCRTMVVVVVVVVVV